MPLYDIDGTATGTATVTSSVALDHEIVDSIVGGSSVTADTEKVFNMSGFVVGSGELIHDNIQDVAGTTIGGSSVSGDLLRWVGVRGYTQGSSLVTLSELKPIYGIAVVTAYMDVIHVPPSICETPTVSAAFRFGYVFTRGDLAYSVVDSYGRPFVPVSVGYTLYQMQQGCVLKQIGPSGHKPASYKMGCYYVTGTAGECGQPGLWVVRWCYQSTYSDPVVEEDCYFQVLDAVSCPIPGDTLERHCKFGWE